MRASLQLRMSLVLSGVILTVAMVASVVSFVSARHEAHKLQDSVLYQIAEIMQQQSVLGAKVLHLPKHDDDADVLIWPLRPDQPRLQIYKNDREALLLPNDLKDGAHTLTLGHETYRVMIRTGATRQRIAVAQETDFRNGIATHSAIRTIMPMLILVPLLVLMVVLLIRNMFRPITLLSAEIDRREEQDLHPVADQHLLAEIRPFVRAINRLLARVAQSMETQRRFVADAAHELRSPMTALSLQAERLAGVDVPGPARTRLTELRSGIERVRELLNQLLALARVQSIHTPAKSAVSVQATYRRVLEDLMPWAEAKRIDIGLEGNQDASILVNELGLTTLVKNLVDNAIRYTPEAGRIDLSITREPGWVTLHVADTGPGIAPQERERVFDPFYRILGSGQTGSGLGLAIVRTLVKQMGANITLEFTDPSRNIGLHVSVRIPDRLPRLPNE